MKSASSVDAFAIGAILLGVLVPNALSISIQREIHEATPSATEPTVEEPTVQKPAVPEATVPEPPSIPPLRVIVLERVPDGVIDFAIIRGKVEIVDIMSGPEDERSGWTPSGPGWSPPWPRRP